MSGFSIYVLQMSFQFLISEVKSCIYLLVAKSPQNIFIQNPRDIVVNPMYFRVKSQQNPSN